MAGLITEPKGMMQLTGFGNGERDNALEDGTVVERVGEYTRTSLYEEDLPYEPGTILPRAERHPNSARFHELLGEIGRLHDRKQADYGSGDDPFANVRASTEWGLPGWVGAMVRLTDKVRRLQALATRGSLSNEAAEDSFLDIAVYALIALVLFEDERTV